MAAEDFILRFNLMENNDDIELLALVESAETKETFLKIFDFPCESLEVNCHSDHIIIYSICAAHFRRHDLQIRTARAKTIVDNQSAEINGKHLLHLCQLRRVKFIQTRWNANDLRSPARESVEDID